MNAKMKFYRALYTRQNWGSTDPTPRLVLACIHGTIVMAGRFPANSTLVHRPEANTRPSRSTRKTRPISIFFAI
ncbi:MAG: hypothetical protein IPN75_15455 [Dechloromonas sp.]|uniref:Uncharacterized protein n=1 Tax=Candidatus Dechloromonas phosphorivorans TaxID=2899244 RepID=A0A9D7QP61_9RHOO|nr:hypothetical protein [Candidatus Dechloromonas phosphorivorans]